MPRYHYRAVSATGVIEEGYITAGDRSGAREILKNRGYTPVRIEETVEQAAGWGRRLSLADLVLFCRQLAIILTAGISLVGGLNILRRQAMKRHLVQEAERLYREVQGGRLLSEVMAEVRGMYPPLLVNMVAAGELSGNLETVFSSLADYYERDLQLRQKIKGLMIYPAILVMAATGLIIFFINFLLPEILNMLQENNVPLPLPTRIIIAGAAFLRQNGQYILLTLIVFLWLGFRLLQQPQVKAAVDRFMLRMPLFGVMLRSVIHARFCHTLHMLLRSGIPMLSALESVERVVGNAMAAESIRQAVAGLERGEPVAAGLRHYPFFDELLLQFIAVGEETGEMEQILSLLARNYDRQSEVAITRLTAIIEPALTIIMGAMVGGIVVSVVLPLFNMLDAMKMLR